MKIQQRLMLLGLAAVMVGGFVYSQIYIHEKNRRELREIANELAKSWQEKLGLTKEQTRLLEDLIIEYTIRKNEIINSEVPEVTKIKKLKKVQRREHKTLQKFLSPVEFDAYVGINKKIPNAIMDSLSA